jgi:hypothetical protein
MAAGMASRPATLTPHASSLTPNASHLTLIRRAALPYVQACLSYFAGEGHDATSLLQRADALRAELTLTPDDDDKIAALIALGVTEHAAKAALLACNKDTQRAAAHALEKAAAERARRERKRRELALAKYGKTEGGLPVDASALDALCSLGCAADKRYTHACLTRTPRAHATRARHARRLVSSRIRAARIPPSQLLFSLHTLPYTPCHPLSYQV